MTPLDLVGGALKSLTTNVLRTLLTMLGIIIGIAAVITLTAASEGAQQGVTERIRGLGSNLMFVQPGAPGASTANQLPGQGAGLFLEDARAIDAEKIDGVDSIAAQLTIPNRQITFDANATYRGQRVTTVLLGTESNYQQVRDFYVARGRFITEDDLTKKALTVVLGAKVARELFGTNDPLGESVRVTVGPGRFGVGFNFTVVGVMEEKGANATNDEDNVVIVPLPTFQSRISFVRDPRGRSNVSQINIKLDDRSKADAVRARVTDILRARHGVSEDDFTITTQSQVLSTATEVDRSLQVLVVSIALISLVVGGIGIMNIMLVAVTERTREIGIRKAIGAKRMDILLQFMVEALMVTTVGGFLGVAIGWALTQVLGNGIDWSVPLGFFDLSLEVDESKYVLTPFWILIGLLVSMVTGVVAGVYPAWRAARLDPIEALRHE